MVSIGFDGIACEINKLLTPRRLKIKHGQNSSNFKALGARAASLGAPLNKSISLPARIYIPIDSFMNLANGFGSLNLTVRMRLLVGGGRPLRQMVAILERCGGGRPPHRGRSLDVVGQIANGNYIINKTLSCWPPRRAAAISTASPANPGSRQTNLSLTI